MQQGGCLRPGPLPTAHLPFGPAWASISVRTPHSSSIWRTGSAKASRARWAPATGPCIRPRACDPPAPSQTVRASRMPARKVLTAGFDPGPDMSRVVHHFVVTTVGKTPDVGAGDLHAAEHRIDSLSHGGAMRSARLSWGWACKPGVAVASNELRLGCRWTLLRGARVTFSLCDSARCAQLPEIPGR